MAGMILPTRRTLQRFLFLVFWTRGHNFNANHDRLNTPSNSQHPYAHGLQVPGVLRTVMAYPCSAPDPFCAPMPLFSAAGYSYDGISIGSDTVDNARMIRENAATVSSWKVCKQGCDNSDDAGSTANTVGAIDDGSDVKAGGCFSSTNTVNTLGKGTVTINLLQIGDYVHVGQGQYSQVYSFSHIDHEAETDFLEIQTNGSNVPLELTPDHLVSVGGYIYARVGCPCWRYAR